MDDPERSSALRPRAVRRLAGLGGFLALGLGLSALYVATGRGVPCPFLAVTGWQCPFCGGTRLGAALLHGDVAGAWRANPLVLVGLLVLVLLGAAWTLQLRGRLVAPLPRPLARLAAVTPGAWLSLAAVVGTFFVLLRNLL